MTKRTPEEWAKLAEIAFPTRFLFAEGVSDKSTLRVASDFPSLTDFKTGDDVLFEPARDPMCGGNKARVRKVAYVATARNTFKDNLRVLIDADFFSYYHEIVSNVAITVTDHANLIAGAICHTWLRRILVPSFNYDLKKVDYDFVVRVAQFAFASRYTFARDGIGNSAPGLGKFIKLSSGKWQFDADSYIVSYLGCTKAEARRRVLLIEQYLLFPIADIRDFINSHDFVSLLYYLLRARGVVPSSTSEKVVEKILYSHLPPEILKTLSTSKLVDWARD